MAQILLAEPDRPIRDFIAGILMDFGHDVTTCGDGTEAVALLAIGISLVATLYPSWSAARILPAEALRYE